jgi:hypothetical protein
MEWFEAPLFIFGCRYKQVVGHLRMYRPSPQILGKFSLHLESERQGPIIQNIWGIAKVKGSDQLDSCYIYFIDKTSLLKGDSCSAEFNFKFHDHVDFEKKLEIGQIIEFYEGSRNTGYFQIENILSPKLK